jgi:hypothetical protein
MFAIISAVPSLAILEGARVASAETAPKASHIMATRCAIGDGDQFRVVVPCIAGEINGVFTIIWQFAGRGIGTSVAADGQWLNGTEPWSRCRGNVNCLESGGLRVKTTECAVTESVQPITLDYYSYPILPREC